MPGRNLYFREGTVTLLEKSAAGTASRVFISHKREDADLALKVSEELTRLEIDFWLDIADTATQSAAAVVDDEKLALAIERGLIYCSHLLALISPKTKGSWWVPFEIGEARGRGKGLGFFVHTAVKGLPSYLALGTRILDMDDFYKWAIGLSSRKTLTEAVISFEKSAAYKPLAAVLPSTRSDRTLTVPVRSLQVG